MRIRPAKVQGLVKFAILGVNLKVAILHVCNPALNQVWLEYFKVEESYGVCVIKEARHRMLSVNKIKFSRLMAAEMAENASNHAPGL